METTEQFVETVETALKASGLTPAQFGWKAVEDRNFVAGLRNGRSPTLKTVEKVMEFIRSLPNSEAA